MFNSSIKVNTKQKSILFEAMARNGDVLEGRTFALRRLKNTAWEKLAEQLNKYGPEKDITQWKKCWTDLRLAIRKRYQKSKKSRKYVLTAYGRHVIKSCGLDFSDGGEDTEESQYDDLFEIVEDGDIKEELLDETGLDEFVMVTIPSEEIINDQEHDLMKDTIKIEDADFPPSSPKKEQSESNCTFLSEESVTPANIFVAKPKRKRSETLIEIRKMHRNLLKETRKQTALLRKIVNRLENRS